jgi:hypothetical protein
MVTVRLPGEPESGGAHIGMHDTHTPSGHERSAQQKGMPAMDSDMKPVSNGALARMMFLSFLLFGVGLSVAMMLGGS